MDGITRAAVGDLTESQEQQLLFEWAALSAGRWPELALLYHIPNGGSRSKSEAGRFKAEGVKAGVPDICLPVARGGYHGLYIELKRVKGGRVSTAQQGWIAALREQGYYACVCKGWDDAAHVIKAYLEGRVGNE